MPTRTANEPASQAPESVTNSDPKQQPEAGPKADWNILFYLVGDGLISASMVSQLKAITDAGFEANTNVLVYFDPNCNGRNARIFDVNALRKAGYVNLETGKKTIIGDGRDSYVRDIAEDCHIPSLPQMPAEITLRYFLEYARAYYPAKNHMLFLMGHGVIVGNDAFLPDPDDNSAITLADLGWILHTFANEVRAEGDEFQLVGFHSCSMSSVELLSELAGSARYMIGTQGAAFPGSWPYRQLLKRIFVAIDGLKLPKEGSPEQVSIATQADENGDANQDTVVGKSAANGNRLAGQDPLVSKILDALQDLSFKNSADFWLAGFSSDISICSLNTDRVDKLREALEKLSKALQEGVDQAGARDCIQLAHLESQSYWEENYTDLSDFCSRLWNRCNGRDDIQVAIRTACVSVTQAINGQQPEDDQNPTKTSRPSPGSINFDQLVMCSDYYGPAYQWSNGLSIYFPWRSPVNKVIGTYRGYKFTREHGSKSWWSFLRQYFRLTQRPRRLPEPMRSAPEMAIPTLWNPQPNLLRTLSTERLLSLGPPPARISRGASKIEGDSSKKVAVELTNVGGELKTIAEALAKVGGDLSAVGGDLADKVGGDLAKVGGDLSRVGGDLADKVGGDLARVAGDLADKVGGDLAKLEADLSKVLGSLSKVGGDLSKIGGDLSAGKVGGDLSKVGGDLSKVGGDLAKVGGDLAGKVGGDLSKVGGDLSKVGGDLSKVGGDMGGLYGHTVIKNFSSPENEFITSRPANTNTNGKAGRATAPYAKQTSKA